MISDKELIGILERFFNEYRAASPGGQKNSPDIPEKAAEKLTPGDPVKPGGENGGRAWVSEGKVFVSDPVGGGEPATVIPVPGVDLYVNGLLQKGPVRVLSSDRIEVKPARQEHPGKYRFEFAKNKMEAILVVEPAKVVDYTLYQQDPQENLVLKAFTREVLKSPFTYQDFQKAVAEAGIVAGLEYSEALKYIENPEEARIVVARGFPAEPPVDETVEILFSQKLDYAPRLKENGTVDYHNLFNIYSVEEGNVLAIKRPGIPGKPGLNVFGEVVPPPSPRKVLLHVGKGAAFDEEDGVVYSVKAGRPVAKQSGQSYFIDVEDVLVHEGDVDIESGNLRFKGSLLLIKGNVYDSMAVQATGMIVIGGMVAGARVIANDHVRINGNTVSSNVTAGINKKLLRDLLSKIYVIEKSFMKVGEIVRLLSTHERVKRAVVGFGFLVKLVIERKLTEIPDAMNKLDNLLKSFFVDLPEEVEKTLFSIKKVVADPHTLNSEGELAKLMEGIELVRNFINALRSNRADVEMAGAANSHVAATGNVVIKGLGCYNTMVQAGGDIHIKKVLRGGEIRAAGSVYINEAGTETGVKTVIEAGPTGEVRIGLCYEGVQIKVGGRVGRVMGRVGNLVAKLDRGGDLEITFFRANDQGKGVISKWQK
ncbi:MAG: DUF342 domain-containing protein [Bacillota bacterium]